MRKAFLINREEETWGQIDPETREEKPQKECSEIRDA